MPRYAASTEVSTDRSLAEIRTTLRRYGAGAFAFGEQGDRAAITFELGGRRYRIVLPLPAHDDPDVALTPTTRRRRTASAAQEAWEQATRQRWRALALYVKATLEAAESGITSLETALLPYVVLPGGATVAELVAPQLAEAYATGRLPQLLPGLPAGEAGR